MSSFNIRRKNQGVTINIGAIEVSNLNLKDRCSSRLKVEFDPPCQLALYESKQKVYAIARVTNYIDEEKVELIMRFFIMSHFSYFPLIWMFHDRATNNRINKIHF